MTRMWIGETRAASWMAAIALAGVAAVSLLLAVGARSPQPRPAPEPAPPARVPGIRLPAGFSIETFASDVPNARSLALGPPGVLFVGSRQAGTVYAVIYRDGSARADRVLTVAKGLKQPNGVAWRNGSLYVAEISRVFRFDGLEAWIKDPSRPAPAPVLVTDHLPSDEHHGWKFIRFGPDGKLYVPVGAPCNICEPSDPYAAILRMNADGSGIEVFARGIRNTVGFDWRPGTHELWLTDNGRDLLGDDVPPDELNRAPRAGMHFGYPYCHGGDIADPEFGKKRPCSEFTPPAAKLGPHVASLGMRFYTGTMFPAAWRGRIFIAEHGSWNRTTPIGYRVTTVTLDGDRATAYEPFAEGWLGERGKVTGRPVDVEVLPDGSIVVSDDYAGAIYRITYRQG